MSKQRINSILIHRKNLQGEIHTIMEQQEYHSVPT
jgi:hypothetical protein